MRASVQKWMRESVDIDLGNEAINDAVESLWNSLMRVSLSLFMGGPVTMSIASAAERASIVSIADPIVAPTLADVVVGALAQHDVVVGYTLVTESGSETLVSSTNTRTVPINNVCSVTSPVFAEGAIGWNCYIGSPVGRLAKQNDAPIHFGDAYQELVTGFVNEPDNPSPPVANTTADDVYYIRHLELALSDGTKKAWNAGDLDSDMMRRASSMLSSSSEYQNYYYDFINQRTLELRPAAGAALSPRYFYIQKPRKLRFDGAPLPFLSLPGSTAFLRYQALSLLNITIREFDTALAWETKADKERINLELSVNQMNATKAQTVTPYMC